ncbi:MAG: ribosomal protein S18-alanine N-acetyltransferase [Lachnospiraceae bacterium]|nr:ribosomal protein S18-alanine N-acetyltransferase [Lachnospiraceae bacterium]
MITLREMLDEDVDAVCEIEKETFSMPWKKQDFLKMIEDDNMAYMVILEDGEIIGGAGIREILGDVEITNVAIKEGLRGKGYGRLLLRAVIEKGREIGGSEFTLEVRKSNTAAIRLYTSEGFVTEGVRKNFYEKPTEDGLIMWKRREKADA